MFCLKNEIFITKAFTSPAVFNRDSVKNLGICRFVQNFGAKGWLLRRESEENGKILADQETGRKVFAIFLNDISQ